MAKRSLGETPSVDGLLQRPHDPYWDAPITRREVQEAVNQLATNDHNLSLQNDTTNLVVNFLCEQLGVKRETLDKWVEEKKKIIEMVKAGVLKPDGKGNLVPTVSAEGQTAVVPEVETVKVDETTSAPVLVKEENATQSSGE